MPPANCPLHSTRGPLASRNGFRIFCPTYRTVEPSNVLRSLQIRNYASLAPNLELGSYGTEARRRKAETLEHVLELLPVLKERQSQMAGSLSGGEQQMPAIGRGLMARPKLLMLDEPSLGLAPMLVQRCFEIVKEVHAQGTTVLLVEQNVHHALTLSDHGYVLENGRIVLSGRGTDLLAEPNLRRAYLGA